MLEHYFLLLSVTLNFCYLFMIVPDKNHKIEIFKTWFASYRNDIDLKNKEIDELRGYLETWQFMAKNLADELDKKL
jgi:hypothetical protein